jgi:hypothetical protein
MKSASTMNHTRWITFVKTKFSIRFVHKNRWSGSRTPIKPFMSEGREAGGITTTTTTKRPRPDDDPLVVRFADAKYRVPLFAALKLPRLALVHEMRVCRKSSHFHCQFQNLKMNHLSSTPWRSVNVLDALILT